MSSSGEVSNVYPLPIALLMYPDIAASVSTVREDMQAESGPEHEDEQNAPSGPSAQEIEDLLNLARAEAAAETEKRLRNEYEARSRDEAAKIRQALEKFQLEREDYFTRIESEVVHLALAISAKILHREAQVDPMLVMALVRVAVEKLHEGSSVSVRVSAAEAVKWREYLSHPLKGSTVEIVEDAHLEPGDCILETDLGSANFSIDAQLKEVEQGFCDLLAQRPSFR